MDLLTVLTFVSTVVTGLMAGLYLAWGISVLPGLALLSNIDFLTAFQRLNRAILNVRFKTLFFSALTIPPLTALLSTWLNGAQGSVLLIAAALVLILGHGLITVFGNIPINEKLDKLQLESASNDLLVSQRLMFEKRWRALHWGRTAATNLAFLLLLTVA